MINPWNDMKNNTRRRVNGDNRYDIFWVVDLDGRYTFGIELDFCIKTSKKSIKFIGLNTLRKDFKDATKFYIALNDNSNWQLFVLVCNDIISLLNTCNNNENVLDNIEARLLKWKKFFISNDDDFGTERQMGLFGELSFLNNIAAKQVGFEEALSSWVGADFDKQDFLFNDCAVEIKTYKASKSPHVIISSAYQLYTTKEKLYLAVYSLSINSQGLSVEDIIKSIKHYLDVELEDNVKASILLPDGRYEKIRRVGSEKKNSQEIFIKEAKAEYDSTIKAGKTEDDRTFIPLKGE